MKGRKCDLRNGGAGSPRCRPLRARRGVLTCSFRGCLRGAGRGLLGHSQEKAFPAGEPGRPQVSGDRARRRRHPHFGLERCTAGHVAELWAGAVVWPVFGFHLLLVWQWPVTALRSRDRRWTWVRVWGCAVRLAQTSGGLDVLGRLGRSPGYPQLVVICGRTTLGAGRAGAGVARAVQPLLLVS